MTFKKAMEHYRTGTATDAERQLVEEELEKSRLIAEYLDAQWEAEAVTPAAPTEEMKQVRKTLRRRNALVVLTSVVLAAAVLLVAVFVGVPAAERLYWDPAKNSFGTPNSTDLERMLAAYTELFCPDINISSVTETKTAFATYDISISYWNAYRGGDSLFANAILEKGELKLPRGFLGFCPVNIFDRATYPFYEADETRLQVVAEKLSALPEYVTILAAVSFPEDKTMAEVLAFHDALVDGEIGWTAIRSGPLDEQMLPLCGMHIYSWGSVRNEMNAYYPCFDLKSAEVTPEALETHFKSLLRFSADQAAMGTGIPEKNRTGRCFYTDVLNYVEENGVNSYGCYVVGTAETFLALIESGAVSQVRIQDIWIRV